VLTIWAARAEPVRLRFLNGDSRSEVQGSKVQGLRFIEFVRFLWYAKRSCTEVQSELYMALNQQYITNDELQDVYDHAGRTRAAIRGFINYLVSY
jgi:hypothetical protein